jgi:diguanylate cyclase (GGDEF)-like protein/PAS domain S-box-containing protein
MANSQEFQSTFEMAGVGMAHVGAEGQWLRVNRKLCDMLGYPREALIRRPIADISHPDDLPEDRANARRLLSGNGDRYAMEKRFIRADGGILWTDFTVSLVRNGSGRPDYFIAILTDITRRKSEFRRMETAAKVFETSQEGIFITDAEGTILDINPAFSDITGYARDEAVGQNTRILKSGRHRPEFYARMWEALRKKGWWRGEIWDRRKGGEVYPKWLSASAIRDAAGEITHFIGIFTDLSPVREVENRLYQLTHFDSLTGLVNRNQFLERLAEAIPTAGGKNRKVGVLYLDLDGFKMINDTLGFARGDEVLRTTAERLLHALKDRDTVARLGSDEFGVVLTDLRATENAAAVASRLMNVLAPPFGLEENEVVLSCCVGISLWPDDGEDPETLLRNATLALNHAKATPGKRNFRFFSHEMNDTVSERLRIEQALRGALERGEFHLVYQPKVDLETGGIIATEALIRWRHPALGDVSPARFIPVAEETGLIIPIGEWVLHTACRQNREWRDAGLPPMRVAVNLSARQFLAPDLVGNVHRTLSEAGLDPDGLELEITESLLIEDVNRAVELLRGLKALGMTLAIDDFGTGYSSLSYLKRFPVDAIKIDRIFISDILTDPDDAAITSAIIAMAKRLNLRVTAEGVEAAAHVDFLRERGCEEMQGYYFSRPVEPEEMAQMIREGRALSIRP